MKIDGSQPIGRIAAEIPGAIPVFEVMGIDYACLCDLSLHDAAHAAGIAPEEVEESLRRLEAVRDAESWNDRPLAELTGHLTRQHHHFVRHELGRLAMFLSDLCLTPADVAPDLQSLHAEFMKLSEMLLPHFHHEETSVFRTIEAMEKAWQSSEAVAAPADLTATLHQLAEEHGVISAQLRTMRDLRLRLMDSTELPARCAATLADLATLEAHLHEYMFLENWILFPRAAAMTSDHTDGLPEKVTRC